LTVTGVRGLLHGDVEIDESARRDLVSLLSALEDPATAGALKPSDDLIAVARRHRLSPLLSARAGEALPAELAATFRRDRVSSVARNLALSQAAETCIQALHEAGVRVIVLKGMAYSQTIYAETGARATGDVDLLVPPDARRRAFEVMDRLGYEPHSAAAGFDDPDYHEVAWARAGADVDVHSALTVLARCRIDYDEVWREAQPLRLGQTDALALHPVHAVVFHALHMAIDHFDSPAIYLVDLSRLLAATDFAAVEAQARAWHLHRPLATALALTAAFLPRWRARAGIPIPAAPLPRVIARYGPITPLPRPEQLLRKVLHFDTLPDVLRYTAIQLRRKLREPFVRGVLKRSARDRLVMPKRPA